MLSPSHLPAPCILYTHDSSQEGGPEANTVVRSHRSHHRAHPAAPQPNTLAPDWTHCTEATALRCSKTQSRNIQADAPAAKPRWAGSSLWSCCEPIVQKQSGMHPALQAHLLHAGPAAHSAGLRTIQHHPATGTAALLPILQTSRVLCRAGDHHRAQAVHVLAGQQPLIHTGQVHLSGVGGRGGSEGRKAAAWISSKAARAMNSSRAAWEQAQRQKELAARPY